MSKGKISKAAADRSLRRALRKRRMPGDSRDTCSGFQSGSPAAVRAGSICGPNDRTPELLIADAANLLREKLFPEIPAGPVGIQILLTLPETAPEEELADLIRRIGNYCDGSRLVLTDAEASVSDGLTRPFLSVTAYPAGPGSFSQDAQEEAAEYAGRPHPAGGYSLAARDRQAPAEEGERRSTGLTEEGDHRKPGLTEEDERRKPGLTEEGERRSTGFAEEIYMTGYAGAAGTAILARNYREDLLGRFPSVLVDEAESLEKSFLLPAAPPPFPRNRETVCTGMVALGEGGIFAGLWELARRRGAGLDIDLARIPIRQETIEISELLGIHPYQLYSSGAALYTVCVPEREDGEDADGSGERISARTGNGVLSEPEDGEDTDRPGDRVCARTGNGSSSEPEDGESREPEAWESREPEAWAAVRWPESGSEPFRGDASAVRIGRLTGGKACILRMGEEIRYLENPQPDALLNFRHR